MQRRLSETPRVFHVNWFRRDADGKFLWPGSDFSVSEMIPDEGLAGNNGVWMEKPGADRRRLLRLLKS